MRNLKLKSVRRASALLLASSLVLAACGGGGGGSSSESPGGSSSTTAAGVEEARNLENLQINQAYELRSVSELSVEMQMSSDRSFVSICPEPLEAMDIDSFDYSGCMIRSSLNASTRVLSLTLPNHIDRLVAIVWFYENGKAPLIQRWRRQPEGGYASGSIWRINENG
jgi:hypothetical protein